MRFSGKKRRRFDKGQELRPSRPACRRSLGFEQMEERITLSTSTGGLAITFDGTNFSEGGLISFSTDQVFVGDMRGVIDSHGLSGFEFSATFGTGQILNTQDLITTDIDGIDKGVANFQSRGDLNASTLGGGLEQVIPIAPLEQDPPTQPDGGQVQIAQLFGPSFEQRPGVRSEAGLVDASRTESLQIETEVRAQEYAPAQGREMAFEVASLRPAAAQSNARDSEFNEVQKSEVAPKISLPTRTPVKADSPRDESQPPVVQSANLISSRAEIAPGENILQATLTATSHLETSEANNSAESVQETARDQVFAEWEEQRPAEVEAPTAPLTKERERHATSSLVLGGVAVLATGAHLARVHRRDSLKEIEQLLGREE